MTDELIHLLDRVKGRHVITRSAEEAREVGRRLGVQYVLGGSVRVAGTRLRVTAHLIDRGQGWLLWSKKYEYAWRDVLTMQDEISASITDALQQSGAVLFPDVTEDPEAFTEYLRGRHHRNQRTPDALRASVKAKASLADAIDPAARRRGRPAGAGDTRLYQVRVQLGWGRWGAGFRGSARAAVFVES